MTNVLLKKIEQCRQEMISLSVFNKLTSETVIQTSQELDHLLNQYQKRKYKTTKFTQS